MMIILSGPFCLLCFYLAWLCYRKACYKQTVVLGLFGILLLVITFGFIGLSYVTWDGLKL